MKFDIHPYVGALPVTFGMRRIEVYDLLGPPESKHRIWDGSGITESYMASRYNVAYDNTGAVIHFGFSPGECDLSILDRPIWTSGECLDPNPILLSLDPEPLEFVGTWFYVRIGVTSSGYHDDDTGQYAVTVFPRSGNAEAIAEAKPADTRKYQSR